MARESASLIEMAGASLPVKAVDYFGVLGSTSVSGVLGSGWFGSGVVGSGSVVGRLIALSAH